VQCACAGLPCAICCWARKIAICTLLVPGSLVAVRGMVRALHVPLGFQPQGAMLVDLGLSQLRQAGRQHGRESESDH
jgi:hypothetical protein